jgi:hypothetical protein
VTDAMPPADRDSDRARSQWMAAWPTGQYSPFTMEGEVEQLGKLASGARRHKGWRRWAGRALAVIVLLPFIAAVVALIFRH